MPVQQLKEFLDDHDVKYVCISHAQMFTAQEIAASAHIPGGELAKTVIAKVDGRMVMAVLPASYRLILDLLKEAAGAKRVALAAEQEFRHLFPGCEVGAMPPFGNLYGVDVYVSESLAEDDEIAFNAGSHTELIRMSFRDFDRLVNPRLVKLSSKDAVAV